MTTRRRVATMGTATPPERAAGLAAFDLGERPSAHPPASTPAPPPVQPEPADQADPAPARTDHDDEPPRPTPRRQSRHRSPTAPAKLSPRIPASLFQQINEARRRTGETHEAWFLRIAEAVADQIPQLYPRRSNGSTFPQRPARRRRAPSTEPLVQYPLRLTSDEQAPLHAWHRDLPVSSMSELITSIVRLGLSDALTIDETR